MAAAVITAAALHSAAVHLSFATPNLVRRRGHIELVKGVTVPFLSRTNRDLKSELILFSGSAIRSVLLMLEEICR